MDIVATKEEMIKALELIYGKSEVEAEKEGDLIKPKLLFNEVYEGIVQALNQVKANGNR